MGSLPLNHADVRYLHSQRVGLVINMCREHAGPSGYEMYSMRQVHLPTADFGEPAYEDVLRAVGSIRDHLLSHAAVTRGSKGDAEGNAEGHGVCDAEDGNKVFIHCKGMYVCVYICVCIYECMYVCVLNCNHSIARCVGGRGRAVTVTLCWLLYYHMVMLKDSGFTVTKGMEIIKRGRSCAVSAVGKYKVVGRFLEYCTAQAQAQAKPGQASVVAGSAVDSTDGVGAVPAVRRGSISPGVRRSPRKTVRKKA